jgi:chaperone required for assembly of F1-ATPase
MPNDLSATMTDIEDDETRMKRLMKDRYERPLQKRFYTMVSVSDDKAILLDGRVVKTPAKALLRLPTFEMAKAVAAEWEAQTSIINPALMPLTRFSNTAIDRATSERETVLDDLVKYAGNDLVCYRADRPPDLVQLQQQHWDPVVALSEGLIGFKLAITNAIIHVPQSPETLAAVRHVAAALDPWRLTAIYNLTTLLGSALLAVLLDKKLMRDDAAWAAAHVDEDYQISNWGWDDEARQRRDYRRAEFDGLIHFLNLVRNA